MRPKLRRKSEYWQEKPFFLTERYKDALREIIWKHTRLSRGAQLVALRTVDRFKGGDPHAFANLETLAGECGMHRETLRKYKAEIEKAGLFRFYTPPYHIRKKGYATKIIFPTRSVTKWLRENNFQRTMAKNSPWSKSRNADKTYTDTPAKLQKTASIMAKFSPTLHKSEVGTGAAVAAASRKRDRLADGSAASAASPGCASPTAIDRGSSQEEGKNQQGAMPMPKGAQVITWRHGLVERLGHDAQGNTVVRADDGETYLIEPDGLEAPMNGARVWVRGHGALGVVTATTPEERIVVRLDDNGVLETVDVENLAIVAENVVRLHPAKHRFPIGTTVFARRLGDDDPLTAKVVGHEDKGTHVEILVEAGSGRLKWNCRENDVVEEAFGYAYAKQAFHSLLMAEIRERAPAAPARADAANDY